MSRTGLPVRDLRTLDPILSYTSTILGRERAVVINLKHIKVIITATKVLVLNSKDPMVAPFIQELYYHISSSYGIANPIIASSNGITPPVRDELEHLLDDDMDMVEMYLTDKLAQRPLDETSSRGESNDDESELTNERDEDTKSKSGSFNESSVLVKPNIQELEMLWEAYFVQIDGTLQKLSTFYAHGSSACSSSLTEK